MGDTWDYRLRKMGIAWELAKRMIPEKPLATGAWTENGYLKKVQEIMEETNEIVETIFDKDKE